MLVFSWGVVVLVYPAKWVGRWVPAGLGMKTDVSCDTISDENLLKREKHSIKLDKPF